ncbi:hypothetical protein BH10ACI2_BH10ACI2_12670 [soil metagenome]
MNDNMTNVDEPILEEPDSEIESEQNGATEVEPDPCPKNFHWDNEQQRCVEN